MRRDLIGMGKFVSMVLRHEPERIGLSLDEKGWADIDELITNAQIYQQDNGYDLLTRPLLDEIVQTNDKNRFEYSDDGWRIRARQGHSVDVDLQLQDTEPPELLFHGTAERYVQSIRDTGIDKRKRQYVHLSWNEQTAEQVGKRHGKIAILKVRAKDMHAAGHPFYLSTNNVWLTDYVPPEYIDFADD